MASRGSNEGSPFLAVNIPGPGSNNEVGSTDRGLRKGWGKTRNVRRVWNQLSRMQKTFLFVMIFFVILFAAIVSTTSWVPPDTQSNMFSPYLDSRKQNHIDRESLEPKNSIDFQHNGSWKKGQKVNTPAATLSVPPVPPALKLEPDSGARERKSQQQHQRQEDIRSIISLDPVVTINKEPSKNGVSRKKNPVTLSLNGPSNERQTAVVDAFQFAWSNYRKYAWGRDNLKSVSGTGSDWFGLGLTLVDALDTMYIMGLKKEFAEARDWVENSLNLDVDSNVNLFETTIRVLGGLLSAYHLSGEKVFLTKADYLGSTLSVAFKSPSGVPYSDVNLKRKTANGPTWGYADSTTSEVTSLQLEFRDLSRCTKNWHYEELAMNVSKHIHKLPKLQGLVPMNINPNTGRFRMHSTYTLGARADSYYEYLLKQWIQTKYSEDFLRSDYLLAVEGMRDQMLRRTHISNLTYFGELENGGKSFKPKMDHLVCFLPGTLALGYLHGLPEWHLDIAKELIRTCYETYARMPTKLAPEITYFRVADATSDDLFVHQNDAHNLLRPETVESLWYLYQITGDKIYQDWGWEIFQAFNKYTKVQYGYSCITTVLNPDNVRPKDFMESFFLSETLKYFYLLFADKSIFDLKSWVFNTEAHPFPVDNH